MKKILLIIGLLTFAPVSVLAGVCPGGTTTNNLVSQYEAENNTDDSVGANNASLQNGATYTTGYLGSNAFFLDGTNDYVSAPLSAYSSVSQASWGGWFKKTANPGAAAGYGLISSVTPVSLPGTIAHGLQFFPSNQSLYGYIGNTSNFVKGGTISDTNWHHVFVVFDGTQTGNTNRLKIYIDGIYTDAANGGTIPATVSFPQFFMGSDGVSTNFSTWDGGIDEVRFYNDALTAAEVKTMYINESGGCSLLTGEDVTISSNQPSTLSDYTVTYTTPGGVEAGQTMTLYFPAGFDLSNVDYTDIDVAYDNGGLNELTLGSVHSGSTWGATIVGQDIILRSATGTIPATSQVIVEVGTNATAGEVGDQQIVNPSTGGLYQLDINSTFGDAGDATFSIAGANNVTVTPTSTTPADTDVQYEIVFTPGLPIPDQGSIWITFPDAYNATFDLLASGDISVSGANITGSTKTIDTVQNTIKIVLDASASVSADVTITIGDASAGGLQDLTNPAAGGYAIAVDTLDADGTTMLAQGSDVVEIDSKVSVAIAVAQALVMTISETTVNLFADPSANNGQYLGGKTTLTVSSNADGGYVIKARLDDGEGNAQLVNENGDAIPSNLGAGENYFSYTARNDGTGSATAAEQDFATTNTNLLDNSDDSIGLSTVTNSQQHTINYDLNVDYLTPSGEYTGIIYYTVVGTF